MKCMGCRKDCHSLGFNGLCGQCRRVYKDRLKQNKAAKRKPKQ